MKQEGDQFEMILEDDGKGFVTEELLKVNGVKNMKSRADRYNRNCSEKQARTRNDNSFDIFNKQKEC